MSESVAIRFHQVSKQYHVDSPVADGFKSLLLHLPSHLRAIRARRPLCALRNVSFEVREGECFSLIGRNGAGKSTTLGLIAGVLKPSSGDVQTRGRICPLLELGAGFHPELSGRENIVLNAVLLGLTRREALDRAGAIVEFAEMQQHIHQPLRTYSSGMTARLGFSVAVHLSPKILLIDEALSVGDERFQRKCLKRIERFREERATIVFVSHDLGAVAQVSDRVAYIDGGELLDLGEPRRVIDHYRARSQAA